MSDTITVRNASGQVVSLSFPEGDPKSAARREIVERRINMNELTRVAKTRESARPGSAALLPVEDYHTGLRDEAGNLLKSVHGGGLDPDAYGDVLGQPSGSVHIDGAVVIEGHEPPGDSHPDAVDLTADPDGQPDTDGAVAEEQDGEQAPAEDPDAMKPARARKTAAKRS